MKPIELTQLAEGPNKVWINPEYIVYFGATTFRDRPVTKISFTGSISEDGAVYVTESPDVIVALVSRSDTKE